MIESQIHFCVTIIAFNHENKENSMGKKIVPILIIVLVLLLVYFFVLSPNEANDEMRDTNEESVEGSVEGAASGAKTGSDLIEFRSADYGFSFFYPKALFNLTVADDNDGLILAHPEMLIIFTVVDGPAQGENLYEFELPENRHLVVDIGQLGDDELPEDVQAAIFNQVILSVVSE